MAKLAIVIKNKAANYYNIARPLHSLLVDGTQAGITATKNASAGVQLLGAFGPNGGSDVINWKTAPWGAGPARNTQYSGGTIAIATITGWAIIETPHCWRLLIESAGPVASADSFKFGEILIANDSSLGESATFGNADSRTIYGMLCGLPTCSNSVASEYLPAGTGQSQFFVGAETVRHRPYAIAGDPLTLCTANYMVPTGYGTGDWLVDGEMPIGLDATFRCAYPSYTKMCKQGAYYSPLSIATQICRRIGSSTLQSYLVESPYRKPGATADVLVFSRTVATYITWGDFLQAVWDYFLTGTYWEQDTSV